MKLLEGMPHGDASGYQRDYLLITALLRSGAKERAIAEGDALVRGRATIRQRAISSLARWQQRGSVMPVARS